jgi:hypothetical protein
MSDEDSIFDDGPAAPAAEAPKAPEPAPAPPTQPPDMDELVQESEKLGLYEPAKSPEKATAQEVSKSVEVKAKAKILAEKIFKKGHIVDLHIGGMTFRKKLQPKDIGKKKEDVPAEVIVLGHKRLIKKTALSEIESIRGKAYSIVEEHSTESWIPKQRFMTKEALPKVLKSLQDLRVDFFKAVEKFVTEYPTLKAEMLAEFPQLASSLEPFYPSPAAVRASFHFDVSHYTTSPVTLGDDLLAQAKIEVEEDLMKKIDSFLSDTVKNTHMIFLTELQAVKEKLDGGEKVNAKTIKKIHEMIETAKTKDVAGDTEFLAMLDDFKKKFTVDASKEKSFKDEIKDSLDAVMKAAGDEKAAEETVTKYKRSLIIN